jgi:hypothetical protein
MDRAEIALWHDKACALFPRYLAWWAKSGHATKRRPLLAEAKFDVCCALPSGRVVRLRGKWDSVDLVGQEIWLQENKTKSSIDRDKINRQLTFDLQTMFYWGTLLDCPPEQAPTKAKLTGIRYNVVRRAAHKSIESMIDKLELDQRNGRGSEWFDRWEVRVQPSDLAKFRTECLLPALENLYDDWEWWTSDACRADKCPFAWERRAKEFPKHAARHLRLPYGIYNVVAEGGEADIDSYFQTGSKAGLTQVTNLFPELN